jgi:hypothetical protein
MKNAVFLDVMQPHGVTSLMTAFFMLIPFQSDGIIYMFFVSYVLTNFGSGNNNTN